MASRPWPSISAGGSGPATVRVLAARPDYEILRTVPAGSCIRAAAAAYQAGVP